jgi:hypothetical protein
LIFRRFNPKTIFFSGIPTGLNRNDLIYTSLRLAPPRVNLSSFLYSCQGASGLRPLLPQGWNPENDTELYK